MTSLFDAAHGRDNNFNLIRAAAAFAVLVSHAVPITLGPDVPEPLQQTLGLSLGTLAVMVFFVISGFLITQSIERTASRRRFILARVYRIFPALIVSLIFVALVLGPVVTTLGPATYFVQAEPYTFILRNTLLVPLAYTLPGVFEGQPVEGVVGSIWTLRHEVGCYLAVFILGVSGLFKQRAVFGIAMALWVMLVMPVVEWLAPPLHPLVVAFLKLSIPFAVGMGLYALRHWVSLTVWGIVALAALTWAAAGTSVYYPVLCITVGYATFWLAYVPAGAIRRYNQLGDYSYGIYIYAFPLQGAAVWAFGPQTAFENIVYAAVPTVILSVVSWHWVERPAMDRFKARMDASHPQQAGRS